MTLALRHPDRVSGLVPVDGGFPVPHEGLTPDAVRTAFAPQASRRDRVFATREAPPCLVHAERVAEVDQAASIMTRHGAAAVAEQLRAAVVGAAG